MVLLGVTVFIVVCNLLLGIITFTKNPQSSTNRLFLLLTIILSLWAITNYFSVAFTDYDRILFWIRAVMVVTGAMFSTLYVFTQAFPNKETGLSKPILLAIAIFTVVTQLLAATPLVFKDIIIKGTNVNPVPGLGMPIFALNVLVFLILTIVTLIKKFVSYKGLQKIQLTYLVIGVILTFVLATLTNFLFVNLFHNTSFVAIGPTFTLIMVGFISYAVVKHQFFDIRLVFARSIAFLFLLICLEIVYVVGVTLLGKIIAHVVAQTNTFLVSALLAIAMAIIFQPLRRVLEKATNKVFYKGAYDSEELLFMLSQVMSSSITLKVLTENVMEMLREKIHVSKIEIFVIDQKGNNVLQTVPAGQPPYDLSPEAIETLEKSDEALIFDELPEGEAKEIMRKRSISVFLKLKTTHRIVGFLILGDKTSGEIYYVKDIKTLMISAPQFAVAVENSLAFEEIREFNETLKQDIIKATEDLRLANEQLMKVDNLKDEFISIASHDLRTPLTTVKNFLWLTLDKAKLEPKVKDDLERAYSAANRTALLVSDMLDVSRIEGGRIEMKIAPIALDEVLEEVKDDVTPKALAKKVKVSFIGDKNITIMADHERLVQIVSNLADNAVKFTPQKGSVTISVKDAGDKVEVAVTDTGIGIEKKDLPKLFTKFGRLHNTLSSVPEAPGTGLGLYIAKKMIGLLSGTIGVQSEVGKGTTFTCIFNKG